MGRAHSAPHFIMLPMFYEHVLRILIISKPFKANGTLAILSQLRTMNRLKIYAELGDFFTNLFKLEWVIPQKIAPSLRILLWATSFLQLIGIMPNEL